MIRTAMRRLLERAGYWAVHRQVLPSGVDPLWDMQRLAARHGVEITCAFDVGAHRGQTAEQFLAAFPRATVHSFEPHPNSFACLQQLRSDRLHAHRLAVSDASGPAPFFVLSDVEDPQAAVPASMNNSLVRDTQFGLVAGRYDKSISVERITVDAFCDQAGVDRVDLLKIDTEGHEVAVLAGAAETLRDRRVSFVLLEFETVLPVSNAEGGALGPAAARLEPLGFRFMASYPVNQLDHPLYACFNALFFRPPGAV
ncbi:MAG TPA: FkbM family methyltransferase [Caulobacteraceae bacterium]|nr:FkbM family methyltransferase [Caulobacteraceae bacterium]